MVGRPSRGFTLIELMITLVLLALVTVIAAPNYRGFIANQGAKTVSHALVADLALARSEAAKRNSAVYLYPDGAWANGWAITLEAGKSPTDCRADPTNCLRQRDFSAVHVAVGGGPANVTFDGLGRPSAAAVFTICDTEASASVLRRRVEISPAGLPSLSLQGGCG